MSDLPTRAELFARYRAAALAVPNTRISPREFDRPGSDLNLLAHAAAVMGEEVVHRMARGFAGVFEDTASEECLDRVVYDRKRLPRLGAAPAVGEVQLTRPTAGAGAGTITGGLRGSIPAPTRIQAGSGPVYFLTRSGVFSGAALGPITVPIEAELAGLEYEVQAGAAWRFLDAAFDRTITIANAEDMAGAADEETDEEFKARARAFFPSLRRGTAPAVEFGLRSTPGVASVSVLEVTTAAGLPACLAQAFVLDALGQANETLGARARGVLLSYRPIGIPVVPIAGIPEFINIRILLAFDTTAVLDTDQAAEDVRSAIVSALLNQDPGERLYRTTILAAARSIRGVIVEDSDLIEPAGTLVPAPEIAYRTRRELIATI